ncbi:MAG: Ig-like domain-containing protein [Akkermansiaceae bacterium]|nr:Ig-like domain-containing protein [Akkermansiaceae bacterium]
MAKLAAPLLGMVAVFLSSPVSGQTNIAGPFAGGGALPVGWTGNNNVTANLIDRTSYWLVEAGNPGDTIVTSNYDLSTFNEVIVNVNVATFGSGTNNPLRVEISTDGGTSWSPTSYTTATPTSTTYIAGGPISISGTFTATTALRFSAGTTSGRGVRIQQLQIQANSSGGDTTPPAIASLSPADEATGVALTPTLTITFNENVVAGSGVISLFDSANPSTAIETFDVTTAVTFTGTSASFTPATSLSNSLTYHVQIPSGAILDTASPANAFGGISDATTWNFTTVGPDLTGPVVTALLPADNATLDGSPAELKVTFDETIAAGTGTITLFNAAGNTVVETFNVPGDVSIVSNELSMFPTVTLTPGASYYLQIPAGAVVDTAPAATGFAGILDTTTWSFSLRPVPSLTLSGPYTQDFSAFTGLATLPDGWLLTASGSASNKLDNSIWLASSGGTTGTGVKYSVPSAILGYQHSGSTDIVVKTLTLLNATGSSITDLTVSYRGRQARAGAGRPQNYVVTVNGSEVPSLSYVTSSGDNQLRSSSISGLSIPAGATFTIAWTTNGDVESGTNNREQIGISDVAVSVGATFFPPTVGSISADYSSLTSTSVTVSSDVTGDGGSAITARGIVYSEFSVNPSPELLGTGVTNVPDAAPATGPTTSPITGLTAGTQYAVRAYATNAQGTAYSSVLSIFTLATPPALVTNYTQPFDNFSGSIVTGTLPAGWSVVSAGGLNGFAGNWGPSTSSGGLLGNVSTPNGVLGYQHVGTSGLVTATLTLTNNTGAVIDELYLGYTGRVDRLDQTREPEWTVALDGTVIPELAYSTSSAVDQDKSHTVTGLSIAPGATFTLTWTSDGNVGTGGGRRQIGIADVYVGIEPPPAGGYADWATANGIVGTADDDDDNDGISNLLEYALGLTPGSADSLANSFNGSTLSFTAGAEAVAGGDLTYTIETSPDLGASGPWTTVVTGLDVNNVISYTLPAGTRLFARLRVIQN